MVRQPLEFEPDSAQRPGPRRDLPSHQAFDVLAVCDGVADRRITGDGLDLRQSAFVGTSGQCPLDAAMLISERDLEMEHLFPVALEPEMARLDDACVHGADSHFVNFLALDAEEIRNSRNPRLEV
ncbi:MAG: hypothetical protein BWY66_00225 [bacterium ADurb.Bin374]|nr:MAG: hypothetical protein BWY66_00225 [bacterium ADurb.Bin374]